LQLLGKCKGSYINTGIDTDLVHDGDTGILALLVKLHHGGGDIAGGDNVLLLSDGTLDDGSVEGIGDQRDDKVVLGDLGVEGLLVVDIEGNGVSVLDALGKGLGALEGSASFEVLAKSVQPNHLA
jgi:hypothetical protein